MNTELLPCPFCGGSANVYLCKHDRDAVLWVECNDRSCCCGPDSDSEAGAIAAWNRRATVNDSLTAQPAERVCEWEALTSYSNSSWKSFCGMLSWRRPRKYCEDCGGRVVVKP